MLGFHKPQ